MDLDLLSDPVYMHRRMRLHNISLMRQYRTESKYQILVGRLGRGRGYLYININVSQLYILLEWSGA